MVLYAVACDGRAPKFAANSPQIVSAGNCRVWQRIAGAGAAKVKEITSHHLLDGVVAGGSCGVDRNHALRKCARAAGWIAIEDSYTCDQAARWVA